MKIRAVRVLVNRILTFFKEKFASKLINGIAWSLIGTIALRFLNAIASIFTVRFLGASRYGELGIISSTLGMLSSFAGLGLGVTCTKYIAELKNTDKIKAGKIIGLTYIIALFSGVFMMLLVIFISDWLSVNTLNAPYLSFSLKLASLLLFLNTVDGVQKGSLAGFEAFKEIAKIGMIQGILSLIFTVSLTYLFGVTGTIFSWIINSTCGLVLNKLELLKVEKKWNIKTIYKDSLTERAVIWKLSIPSMLSNIVVSPVIWVANTIIINNADGYSQLGIFNAANQWKNIVEVIPNIIGSVLLPFIANRKTSTDNKGIELVNLLAGWMIVTLFAIILITFPELIGALYGDGFDIYNYYATLALLMFSSTVIAYKSGIGRKLVVNNLMWWGFLDNIIWGIFFIIFVYFLKEKGSLGLGLSYALAYLINTLIFIPFYLKFRIIPRELILSKNILFIWLSIFIALIFSICRISIFYRILIFPLNIVFIFHNINKLTLNSRIKSL